MNAQELLDSVDVEYTAEEQADVNITKICKKQKKAQK